MRLVLRRVPLVGRARQAASNWSHRPGAAQGTKSSGGVTSAAAAAPPVCQRYSLGPVCEVLLWL